MANDDTPQSGSKPTGGVSRRGLFAHGAATALAGTLPAAAPAAEATIPILKVFTDAIAHALPDGDLEDGINLMIGVRRLYVGDTVFNIPTTTKFDQRGHVAIGRLGHAAISESNNLKKWLPQLQALRAECGDMSLDDLVAYCETHLEDRNHITYNLTELQEYAKQWGKGEGTVGEVLDILIDKSTGLIAKHKNWLGKFTEAAMQECGKQTTGFDISAEEVAEYFPQISPDRFFEITTRYSDMYGQFLRIEHKYGSAIDPIYKQLPRAEADSFRAKLNEFITRSIESGNGEEETLQRVNYMMDPKRIEAIEPDTWLDEDFFTKPIAEIAPPVEAPAATPVIYRSLQGFSVWEMDSDDGMHRYLIVPDKNTLPGAIKTKLGVIFNTKGTDHSFKVTPELDETIDSRNLQVVTDSPDAIEAFTGMIDEQQHRSQRSH